VLSVTKLATALGTLTLLIIGWAVPLSGAAYSFVKLQNESKTPVALAPIRFREDRGAGLLVNGWINDAGPFTFAIDTGAGVSLVTSRVAASASLRATKSSRTLIGGLSSSPITSNQEAYPNRVSLGSSANTVPTKPLLAIVNTLPGNIDGILDPTELFGRMAYSIDLPNRQLLVFDGKANGLNLSRVPKDGAVVRWVRQGGSNRPLVKLGDGRLALIDTGSGLGLGVNENIPATGKNHSGRNVSDLGGGGVQTRNLQPTTVSIGALVLRGVPTDLLVGVPANTPTILGRRALFPFKITFDPVTRLIAFEPKLRD
jgi:hypothetical protein